MFLILSKDNILTLFMVWWQTAWQKAPGRMTAYLDFNSRLPSLTEGKSRHELRIAGLTTLMPKKQGELNVHARDDCLLLQLGFLTSSGPCLKNDAALNGLNLLQQSSIETISSDIVTGRFELNNSAIEALSQVI